MIAYFDMFSGISGDMILGAFVDLGVSVEWLKEQFTKMPLPDANIRAENIWHNGIKAANLFIDDICHDLHHDSRNYLQIKNMVLKSPFSDFVKSSALKAFEKIAIAESEIHGTSIEDVHFHEVGGVDAIVDIVGAFLCVEYLGISEIFASIPPLGRGFVKCSHGVIPIPAPATIKILKGFPIKASECNFETVTPTGAAIITTMTKKFGDMPEMIIKEAGYGSGKRKTSTGLPNMLRIITGQPKTKETESSSIASLINPNIIKETVCVIETSIDDMNPEIAGYIMQKLFEYGALDVSYYPLFMKKNRPAFKLEVICKKATVEELIEIILTESTSSGVRFYSLDRATLAREKIEIETSLGKIAVKQITDPKGKKIVVPEYEVCRNLAQKNNIPIKDVYSLINRVPAKLESDLDFTG